MSTNRKSYTAVPLPVAPTAVPKGIDVRCDGCGRPRVDVAAMLSQAVERRWDDGTVDEGLHHLCGGCESAAGYLDQ